MSVERTITAARNGVSAIWASDVFWLLSARHAATNFGNIERAFARRCATAFNIHFSIPINAPATGQLSGATKAQFFPIICSTVAKIQAASSTNDLRRRRAARNQKPPLPLLPSK